MRPPLFYTELMQETDVAAVRQIDRECFGTPWAAITYLRELRSPATCHYLVARCKDGTQKVSPKAQGSGFLQTLATLLFGASNSDPLAGDLLVGYGGLWFGVDEVHITTLAVAPTYQGHGIGELLLNGLIDQTLTQEIDLLTLEVRVSNVVGQNLYRKYGFEVMGKRRHYYTDDGEDALIMTTPSLRQPAYQAQLKKNRQKLKARLANQAKNFPKTLAKQPEAGGSIKYLL